MNKPVYKKKILHFVNDEKFIVYAYQVFNSFDNVINDFTMISTNDKFKYISFSCNTISPKAFLSCEYIEYLNSYDLIIIHFLDKKYYKLLSNKKFQSKVLWIGWGGDYYWLIDTIRDFNIFKPQTSRYLSKIKFIPFFIRIKKILKKYHRANRANLINRISYFSPVLLDDYLLIKKNYPDFLPEYIPWNYGNLEDNYINEIDYTKAIGMDILIGNSATPTNNHVDVIEILKRFDLKDKKVIIPLNYGDMNYGNFVKFHAEISFRKNLFLLQEFMPYEKYFSLIKNCGNVFMGHIRQQALGNIITLIYLGAKIFFFKESVVYKSFLNKGIKVFSIDELQSKPELLEYKFSQEILESQRLKLLQDWGRQPNLINTYNIISLIEETVVEQQNK